MCSASVAMNRPRNEPRQIPAASDRLTRASELDLGQDESEARPSPGLDRALEPGARPRRVALYEMPIPYPVSQSSDLNISRVRQRDNGICVQLPSIQLQSAGIGVVDRQRIGTTREHRLGLGVSTGA